MGVDADSKYMVIADSSELTAWLRDERDGFVHFYQQRCIVASRRTALNIIL
jgi:hypothetical protein